MARLVHQPLLLSLLVATTVFAGCVEVPEDLPPIPMAKVQLEGAVLTPNLNPIEGAIVSVRTPGTIFDDGSKTADLVLVTAETDVNGTFSLEAFPGNHAFTVTHPEYRTHDTTVTIPQNNLTVKLQPLDVDIPYHDAFPFDGFIECALEAGIITPSCDTLSKEYAEEGRVFEDNSVFTVDLPRGWETIVLDVVFDPNAYPGIAGLRASAYQVNANAEVFDYERITQDWAAGVFSIRIDADGDYGDQATAPSSIGGGIRYEFFPHGHGDDSACIPEEAPETDPRLEPGRCFLGAGAAQNVEWTATATVFVFEPAPAGFTTLIPGQEESS